MVARTRSATVCWRSCRVVKTAAAIVVSAIDDVIDSLGFVINRDVNGIVVTKPHARHDVNAVSLVAADCDGCHVGDWLGVKRALRGTLEGSRGRLVEVVVSAGLIIDDVDDADRVDAERILRDCIRISARVATRARGRRDGLDCADVQGLTIRVTLYLVERTIVGGVQRARGAVGGYTGRTRSSVDIAGALRPGRSGSHQRGRRREHSHKTDCRFHILIDPRQALQPANGKSHPGIDGREGQGPQHTPPRKRIGHFRPKPCPEPSSLDRTRHRRGAAVRANVAFYPIDARGLMALPPGGDASRALCVETGSGMLAGTTQQTMRSGFYDSQETLYTLAAETGGIAFLDSNDLTAGLRRAEDDISTYYELRYYSTNRAVDGIYRRYYILRLVNGGQQADLSYRRGLHYASPKTQPSSIRNGPAATLNTSTIAPLTVDSRLGLEVNYLRITQDRYLIRLPSSVDAIYDHDGCEVIGGDAHHVGMSRRMRRATTSHSIARRRDELEQSRVTLIDHRGGLLLAPPGSYRFIGTRRVSEGESVKVGKLSRGS